MILPPRAKPDPPWPDRTLNAIRSESHATPNSSCAIGFVPDGRRQFLRAVGFPIFRSEIQAPLIILRWVSAVDLQCKGIADHAGI